MITDQLNIIISRFSCCGQIQFYIKQITVLLKANSEKKSISNK